VEDLNLEDIFVELETEGKGTTDGHR